MHRLVKKFLLDEPHPDLRCMPDLLMTFLFSVNES